MKAIGPPYYFVWNFFFKSVLCYCYLINQPLTQNHLIIMITNSCPVSICHSNSLYTLLQRKLMALRLVRSERDALEAVNDVSCF